MSILKIEPQVSNSSANFAFGNVFAANYYYANGAIFSGGGGTGTVKYTTATTPPASNNSPGDQWFNTSSQVLYEYINDGSGNYWVDILTPTFSSTTSPSMVNGNSIVSLDANSNLSVSISGTSNVMVVSNVSVTVAGNIVSTGKFLAGLSTTTLVNPIAVFSGSGVTYDQVAVINSTGTGSADYVTYGNNGDDTQSWTDIGFTGNSFNDANYTVTAPGDGYLFVQGNASFGGNLVISTGNTGTTKDIVFSTGGFQTGNIKARLYNSNGAFAVFGNLIGGNISTTGTLSAGTLALSGATVTGNLAVNGWTTLQQSTEIVNAVTGATGVVVHDVSIGSTYYHTTPAASFTANFTNVPTTEGRVTVVSLIVVQGSTPYVPNAVQIGGSAQTIKWIGSAAPTGTASKTDIVTFSLLRISGAWVVYGQYATYG